MKIKDKILVGFAFISCMLFIAYCCYDFFGSVPYAIAGFICTMALWFKITLRRSKWSKEQWARYEEEYYKYHWLERILKEYYEKKKKDTTK
jgi:hypothetical protein